MAAEGEDRNRDAELRAVLVESAVTNLLGIALQVGIMVVILKRDWLWRQWRRYRWHVLREWRGTRERQLISELSRDISRMQHEGIPPDGH